MSAPQEHFQSRDEIDLIELFSKLWSKKLTILFVSFLCGCGALVYLFLTPGKYSGEFVLRGPTGDQLAAYVPLNDGIKKHYAEFLQNTGRNSSGANQFEITADGLVAEMVRELHDLEEFESAIKEHSSKYTGMSDEEFFDARGGIISAFTIAPATDRDPEVRVILEWHNERQLLDILMMTLMEAEDNLSSGQLRLLNGLAENIERRTLGERESLDRDILSTMEVIDLETEGRLLFLKEQASIARELGLAENGLAEGSQENQFSFSISSEGGESSTASSSDLPEALYLRGFKSLEREIDLIEARVGEQKYLLNQAFLDAKRKAIALKNDASSKLFLASIETSPFAFGTEVFNIRKERIRVTNMRNAPLILALSLFFGFFVSCVFVLMRGALQRQNSSK